MAELLAKKLSFKVSHTLSYSGSHGQFNTAFGIQRNGYGTLT